MPAPARNQNEDSPEIRDGRDSMGSVGLSLFLFLPLEYFVELNVESLPGGMVFPMGFLLFWAFFYTYYQPQPTESQLKPLSELAFPSIAGMVFGVLIWFVKVTVVGIFDFLFVRWFRKPAAKTSQRPFRPRPEVRNQFNDNKRKPVSETVRPPPPKTPQLPPELLSALTVLGLEERTESWDTIHKRYRELAKKFHPDLNQEITRAGNRFIQVDQAYRKLNEGRGKFFH